VSWLAVGSTSPPHPHLGTTSVRHVNVPLLHYFWVAHAGIVAGAFYRHDNYWGVRLRSGRSGLVWTDVVHEAICACGGLLPLLIRHVSVTAVDVDVLTNQWLILISAGDIPLLGQIVRPPVVIDQSH